MTTAHVDLLPGGTGSLTIDGTLRALRAPDLDAARDRARQIIAERAAALDRPITTTASEPDGTWTVVIHPDGAITAPPAPAPDDGDGDGDDGDDGPSRTGVPAPAPDDGPVIPAPTADELETPADAAGDDADWWAADPDAESADDRDDADDAPPRPRPPQTAHAPAVSAVVAPSGGRPRPARASADQRAAGAPAAVGAGPLVPAPTAAERRARALRVSLLEADTNTAPAVDGWRGSLNRHLHLRLAPGARERGARDDIAAVARHWPGPRTIAVVNGKGGSGKTPTTILLAAVLARHGGAGVVAYDNNPTRGTLGWRTRQGSHTATVVDLLPRIDHFLSPAARAAELADLVHHQAEDRYDVLRSQPEALADSQAAGADDFNAVHDVLARYYRLIVVDSGNDEASPQWRAMIARADAIVVPTTTRPEHAEAARLLLDELSRADARAAALAEAALVVVSRASRAEPDPAALTRIFRDIARAAVAVPYDPAMAGRPLILDSLAPATRRAWLTAAAALAGGLHR